MFNIQTIHPNISVITFAKEFADEDWDLYERKYRELYKIHTRAIFVFDLRAITINVTNIVNFIMRKKKLLLSLKAKTCQTLFAAIVVTEYEFISDLVLSIAKLSGQASLFYACSDIIVAGNTASRLACILNNRRIVYHGGLRWRDLSEGSIAVLLMAAFLRHARHFIIPKQ